LPCFASQATTLPPRLSEGAVATVALLPQPKGGLSLVASNTTLPPRLSEGAVATSYFYSQNKNKNRVVAALHHRQQLREATATPLCLRLPSLKRGGSTPLRGCSDQRQGGLILKYVIKRVGVATQLN